MYICLERSNSLVVLLAFVSFDLYIEDKINLHPDVLFSYNMLQRRMPNDAMHARTHTHTRTHGGEGGGGGGGGGGWPSMQTLSILTLNYTVKKEV